MAVKDGLGPRPVAQTAKRHFLNRLETSSQTLTLPPFLHPARVLLELAFVLQPPCSCPPGAGFRSAQLRSKLESKDPVAGLKPSCLTQNGACATAKQQGPAGHGRECLTLLSEPTRKASCLTQNGACATAKQQGPERRTGPAGHGREPKTAPAPQPNSRALRDGPGLRATAVSA